MSLEKIVTNTLALIIGVPFVIVGGLFAGLMLPALIIGGAAMRALHNDDHYLTVVEDNGSDCLIKCSCGEMFVADACTEENVQWNPVQGCNIAKCPRS